MTALLDEVLALNQRGLALIPVPRGQKAPTISAWQDLRLDADGLCTAFAVPHNVGLLLGDPSGGIIDVDLDAAEARLLADAFLPPTSLISGRASSPASHCFYRVTSSLKTTRYRDPRPDHEDRAMLVELRSTGTQTVIPPSIHPSGEAIVWDRTEEPAEVDAELLQQAVAQLAACSLLARTWPGVGSRHDAALALGGGLLRAGWDAAKVSTFIRHVTMAAGDPEVEDRVKAVESTAAALAQGHPTTGWPTLATLIELAVVDTVRTWLGIQGGDPPTGEASSIDLTGLPFPVDVFAPPIATFIRSGAETLGIPPDFIAVPLLSLAAGVIGHLRVLELKPGWTERAILWTGVVGRPGSGKSPGLDYAQQLINDLQQRAWITYQQAVEAEKRALAEQKPGTLTARVRNDPPRLESFYTSDVTIEALASLIDASPGLCLIRDELVGWVKAHDAYRQAGDRQTWLSLWAGSALKIDRKSTGTVFIPAPSVSVTGGLQPDRLHDLRDAANRDDGFVDRFLLAWPAAPPLRWTDAVVDPAVVRAAQLVFARLRTHADGRRRHTSLTRFDDEARARFIAWHDANAELVGRGGGLVSGWAAKYPRQVARLALILHALQHPDAPLTPVTVDIVDGAIALIEYFRSHLPPILTHLGQSTATAGEAGHLSRVATLLRAAQGTWVSRTDLHAGLGRNVTAATLTTVLDQLASEGVVDHQVMPTGGRPREMYRWVTNEQTKKASSEESGGSAHDPFFVSSFVWEDDDTCCLCGEPREPGRRYTCVACGEEERRRNAALFGEEREA
jgi:hypothetical protein